MLCRVLVFVAVTCGSSAVTDAYAAENPDPWEPFNRKVQAFNDTADKWVLRPVARAYVNVLPDGPRRGIGNFLSNVTAPLVAINQALQGKFGLAGRDTLRFVTNTTIGVGGHFDPATKLGLVEHEEDFGQTFARWGIGRGPYLVVPIWGPVTLRSGAGDIVDGFANPMRLVDNRAVRWTYIGVSGVHKRSELLAAEALIAGDRYLFFRDAYLQRRDFLINDGEIEEDPFLDDF